MKLVLPPDNPDDTVSLAVYDFRCPGTRDPWTESRLRKQQQEHNEKMQGLFGELSRQQANNIFGNVQHGFLGRPDVVEDLEPQKVLNYVWHG